MVRVVGQGVHPDMTRAQVAGHQHAQSKEVRDTDRSRRPPETEGNHPLQRTSGAMKSRIGRVVRQ